MSLPTCVHKASPTTARNEADKKEQSPKGKNESESHSIEKSIKVESITTKNSILIHAEKIIKRPTHRSVRSGERKRFINLPNIKHCLLTGSLSAMIFFLHLESCMLIIVKKREKHKSFDFNSAICNATWRKKCYNMRKVISSISVANGIEKIDTLDDLRATRDFSR